MSSVDNTDFSTVIEQYGIYTVSKQCIFAAAVLLFYEYLITLDQEIKLFWQRRLTGSTALFLLNRYLVLLIIIYDLAESTPMSEKSCILTTKAYMGFTIWQYLPWALLSALRAFALSRNIIVAAVIFVLSIVTIGVNMAQFGLGLSGINDPLFGCEVVVSDVGAELEQILTIASRGSLVIADALLLYVTWSAAGGRFRNVSSETPNYLSKVLFRDGMLYVVAILFLNILQLVLLLCLNNFHTTEAIDLDYVTQFTEPLTAIVYSRFLLALQAANRKSCNMDTPASSADYAGSLVFERVIGSIGSSLGGEPQEEDDVVSEADHIDDIVPNTSQDELPV